MRLTEKVNKKDYPDFSYDYVSPEIQYFNDKNNKTVIIGNAIDKLGQIEDIEDELRIDLITLFKALTQKVYVKRLCCNERGFYIDNVRISTFNMSMKAIYLEEECEYQYEYDLKDYGKTWALTKEELL